MRRSWLLTLVSGLLAAAVLAAEGPASPVFEVPKLDNITIDGKADDWGDQGFRVDVLADAFGKVPAASNYAATFRLGWNDKGLLVLAGVTDDVFLEPSTKPEELWKGDSIEFFMASVRGGSDSFQVVVAPGCDPNSPDARTNISDYRQKKEGKLTIEVARTKDDKSFVLEALVPWKNLGLEAQEGKEVAFQFYANDTDKVGERMQLLWYPVPEANTDTNRMYSLKLAAKPSPPVRTAVFAAYDADGKAQVTVVAAASLKGKKIKVKDGDKEVGKEKLSGEGAVVTARAVLKSKDKGQAYGPLTVLLDDEVLATVTLPEPPAK